MLHLFSAMMAFCSLLNLNVSSYDTEVEDSQKILYALSTRFHHSHHTFLITSVQSLYHAVFTLIIFKFLSLTSSLLNGIGVLPGTIILTSILRESKSDTLNRGNESTLSKFVIHFHNTLLPLSVNTTVHLLRSSHNIHNLCDNNLVTSAFIKALREKLFNIYAASSDNSCSLSSLCKLAIVSISVCNNHDTILYAILELLFSWFST